MAKLTQALQFSGGKDSRAILHMYRDQLEKTLVVWLDAGAAYPGTEAEMLQVAKDIPHFLVVRGNQGKQIAENGYPSDVVPIRYTPLGRACIKSADEFKIQSAFDCCSANLWRPLHGAMKLLDIKTVIRGQRKDEEYTNPFVTNGTVLDGIKYVLPIEEWSKDDVVAYLKANNVELPSYYQTETTSHDCWNCTAYLKHYESRIRNLPQPQRAEVTRRLGQINQAIKQEMAPIEALLKP